MRDHGKIVAHQQITQVPFFTNIAKQVQYLGLDGNVKRRGRLIEQKNLWLEQQRTGDGNSLALASGELMWVTIKKPLFESHVSNRHLYTVSLISNLVNSQRISQGVINGASGMERAKRVLEDNLNPAALIS